MPTGSRTSWHLLTFITKLTVLHSESCQFINLKIILRLSISFQDKLVKSHLIIDYYIPLNIPSTLFVFEKNNFVTTMSQSAFRYAHPHKIKLYICYFFFYIAKCNVLTYRTLIYVKNKSHYLCNIYK